MNHGQYFSYIQYDGENAFDVACKTYAFGYKVESSGILMLDTEKGRHIIKKGTVIIQYSDGKLLFMKEETFREKHPDLKL